jgi:transcriptional regulator with XRE-family HTH domain
MNEDNLSTLFQRARKAQGLTQRELEELSGVSASVIYKVERGRTDVTLERLLALAAALGVKVTVKSPLGQEIVIDG